MTEPLVFSRNGNLYLNIGMTQSTFSKARIIEHLLERGVKAEHQDGTWKFSKWTFTGTVSENTIQNTDKDNPNVLLEGPLFSGLPLMTFFESDNKTKEFLAGSRVCSAIESALEQKIPLPAVGAGGIFIAADFERILFLPEQLFETATLCAAGINMSSLASQASQEGSKLHAANEGFYINKNLTKGVSSRFTQAVIAYRILTGNFPFEQTDIAQREEDFRDKNFIPIKYRIWGLDPALAISIDNALSRQGAVKSGGNRDEKISGIITEGRSDSTKSNVCLSGLSFPVPALYKELGLTESGDIPSDGNLLNVIRKAYISHDQFDSDCRKYQDAFTKKLNIIRWFRHNRPKVTVFAVTAAVLFVLIISIVSANLTRPTTRGLTEYETIEMFYSALNTMDISSASECAKCKQAENMVTTVSTFYVASKSRAVYETNHKTVTPSEWMSFNNDGSYDMYGLSQFYIGNTKSKIFFEGPVSKQFPKPVTQSGGVELKNGDSKKFEVSYYFIYSDDNNIYISHFIDNLTLTYKSKRWIITSVTQNETQYPQLVKKDFSEILQSAIDSSRTEAKADIAAAADSLRESYEWIPLSSEILSGQEYAKKQNIEL